VNISAVELKGLLDRLLSARKVLVETASDFRMAENPGVVEAVFDLDHAIKKVQGFLTGEV
jgi:hypothetical protein